jgi:broad specificity phosphatase PhoE
MRRGVAKMAAAVLTAVLGFCGIATASEPLWALLQAGGRVVLVRHAVTAPGVGDPPGMRLDDCSTQRNLVDDGRRHARRIGEAFRRRNIPVESVLASPWCRCVETARLAFGRADVSPPLGNLFGRPENREAQLRALQPLVANWRGKGNLVLVSHGSTISALTGIGLDTAEMLVVTPRDGGSFVVDGRLSAHVD